VVALGTVQELYTEKEPAALVYDTSLGQNEFALKQTTMAITHLNKQLSSAAPRSGEMVLLVCLLLFYLEVFRGNQQVALNHLDNGLKILGSWLHDSSQSDLRTGVPKPPLSFLKEVLLPIFLRLDIGVSLYLPTRPVNQDIIDPAAADFDMVTLPDRFSSLREVDQIMNRLLHIEMHLVYQRGNADSTTTRETNTAKPVAIREQQQNSLNSLLDDCRKALEKYERSHQLDYHEHCCVLILKVKQLSATMFGSFVQTHSEMNFDGMQGKFEKLVTLTSSLLKLTGENFICDFYDLIILVALFRTVSLCRDPTLRRRALTLLVNCPQRKRNCLAAVAKWTMEKEELGLGSIISASQVPVEARISVVTAPLAFLSTEVEEDPSSFTGGHQVTVHYHQGSTNIDGNGEIREELVVW
jgi:hypothetical protein